MASQVNYIDSADGAERNAAVRMRELGFLDARTTGPGSDGGIDVVAGQALGQVKWQGAQVGRPELQQFYGARGSRSDQALLFFSATGYSKQALAYADDNYIATFTYDPLGRLTATNRHASAVVAKSEADQVAARKRQKTFSTICTAVAPDDVFTFRTNGLTPTNYSPASAPNRPAELH